MNNLYALIGINKSIKKVYLLDYGEDLNIEFLCSKYQCEEYLIINWNADIIKISDELLNWLMKFDIPGWKCIEIIDYLYKEINKITLKVN